MKKTITSILNNASQELEKYLVRSVDVAFKKDWPDYTDEIFAVWEKAIAELNEMGRAVTADIKKVGWVWYFVLRIEDKRRIYDSRTAGCGFKFTTHDDAQELCELLHGIGVSKCFFIF